MGPWASPYLLGGMLILAPAALVIALLVRARARSAASFRNALLRATPEMMFLLDRNGVYLDYHANNPDQLYAPPSFFLGRRMRDVMPPDLATVFEEAFTRVGDKPLVVNYSLPMVGGLRHFEARLVRSGRDNILSTVRDVSRERVSDLAASVVHEVNQPLSAIMTNAQAGLRFLDSSGDVAKVSETLTDIVAEVRRARDVVYRTRELFRSQEPPTQQPFSMAQSVNDVLLLVRSRAQREAVDIKVDVGESLPQALGDRVQVQQALLNLFVNALDALAGIQPVPRMLVIRGSVDEDHRIRMSVRDTGRGIPEGQEHSIFSPFYTTKRDGVGLGLVVSRSIVQAHGGRLWMTRNGDGPGVTFWLTIPAVGVKKG